MKINDITSPEDILEFFKDNIEYGWLDINNEKHIKNMKGFRSLYRTSSIDEVLKNGIGTCIEQVFLMKYLFDKINIPSKMFCTRIYEGSGFNNLEAEEHMHCFLLYFLNDKVYHLEYPNSYKIGIYEYNDEKTAIKKINDYFEKMANNNVRAVTEFYDVPVNLSFKEFNMYINKIDE